MKIDSEEKLRAVLDRITFRASCVNMDWKWEIEEIIKNRFNHRNPWPDVSVKGWLVNTNFQRPDTDTGVVGRGKGRQEFISYGASSDSVVKTCWLLAELIVRHELMEAFCFDGKRVFDPHKTIEELTYGKRNET